MLSIAVSCSTKPRNRAPTATFIITPAVGTVDTLFTFDATPSADPDEEGEYLQVRWDWNGDGNWDTLWGAGKQKTHRFEDPGSYAVALQVRDSWGLIAFCVQDLVVGENLYYPVAHLSVSPTFGTLDTVFSFDASGSAASIGAPESRRFRWDWEGDGTWDIDWSPESTRDHQYSMNAVFTAAVEVRNSQGNTDTAFVDVTVFGAADMPLAAFTLTPETGTVVTEFQFDASSSSDAQDPSSALEIRWDWEGDGGWDTDWSTTKTASRRYLVPGDHLVRLVVRDTHQYLAVSERNVPVTNSDPVASLTVTPPAGHVGNLFTLDATGSTDAEEPSSDLLVRWDWEGDGIWDTGPSLTKLVQRYFNADGTYHIVVEVIDCAGARDTTSVDLVVTNTPPVAVLTVSETSGTVATEFVFDASGSSDLETPDNLQFRWDWEGDGVFDRAWSPQDSAHHIYDCIGTKTVTVEVRDPQGLIDSASTSIDLTNTAPTAVIGIENPYQMIGYSVSLIGWNSHDLEDGSTGLQFRWDVDSDGVWDRDWSSQPNHSVIYTLPGSYTITLQVMDTGGLLDSCTAVTTVAPSGDGILGISGEIFGALALSPAEDRVYVAAGSTLRAYDGSFTSVWGFSANGRIESSPAVDADGTAYVVARGDSLYSIDSAGHKKWASGLPGLYQSPPGIGPDGAVFVATRDSVLWALEADGTIRWSCDLDGTVERSSPAVGPGGMAYVTSTNGVLWAINPDGSVAWASSVGSHSQSSPAIGEGGQIYVCSDVGLSAVSNTGGSIWQVPLYGFDSANVVVAPDGDLMISSGNELRAYTNTGDFLWVLKDVVMQWSNSMAVGADGIIYLGASDGYVFAVKPGGTVFWKKKWTSGIVWSAPAIASDGKVWFAPPGGLFVFQTHSFGLASSTWPRIHHDNQNTGRKH